MSAERIPAMISQIETLQQSVTRIEALITREIQDLKNEQIADLRRQNDRLADDQRRAWEAIRALENERNRMYGGVKVIHAVVATVSGLVGAGVAALVGKFLK